MDYAQLKKEIAEAADIAASVPEAFREKCFEVLLTHLLSDAPVAKQTPPKETGTAIENTGGSGGNSELKLPSQVRVFMQRTSVTLEQLRLVVTREDDEVEFIREPHSKSIAQAQIDWSLMLALKSAFEKNTFLVDPEDVQMHYTAMLCYRALGRTAEAERESKLFLRFKADESSQAITGARRQLKPEENNERQQIHEHESVPLDSPAGNRARPAAPRPTGGN